MSSAVFPSLQGIAWNVKRSPRWSTRVQAAVSGKETRIADWSYPRWQWELAFEFLRGDAAHAEFQALAGFLNARQGQFDSFLYQDADDNAVTGQAIAIGDGTTKIFQLARSFGGFTEPVQAPNAVNQIYLNGVAQPGTLYSVSSWGAAIPGAVTFTTAPGAGVVITADFSFYFPCRFLDDSLDFEKFMFQLWQGKKIRFQSIK